MLCYVTVCVCVYVCMCVCMYVSMHITYTHIYIHINIHIHIHMYNICIYACLHFRDKCFTYLYVTFHCVASHNTALHDFASHCITLHYITLHLHVPSHSHSHYITLPTWPIQHTQHTLHYTLLQYIPLHYRTCNLRNIHTIKTYKPCQTYIP